MARRRIVYLAVLISSIIFYWAYQKWLGWLLFLAAICLPVLSLVLSLPGLFGLKLHMAFPSVVLSGDEVYAQVTAKSWLPTPMYDCVISVRKPLTGEEYRLRNGEKLPTGYCGTLQCRIEKVQALDCLGLFRFRLWAVAEATLTVRPKPITVTKLPQLHHALAVAWKPKPGGGFAENHEVRLYRPGDNLNQIHWKLSSKTGKLVIREPMIPAGQEAVVGLCLFGSDEELDRKFGRLMGVCTHLQEMGIPFELQAVTAEGVVRFPIQTEQELTAAIDKLLGMEPASAEQELSGRNAHIYWIGGKADGE